jgi:hypothetical protein
VHIYTQTLHRTTQLTTLVGRLSGIRTHCDKTKINDELTAWKLSPNWEESGPCPVFARYTLAFALQLRKKHGKSSVNVVEESLLVRWKQNIQHIQNIQNTACCFHICNTVSCFRGFCSTEPNVTMPLCSCHEILLRHILQQLQSRRQRLWIPGHAFMIGIISTSIHIVYLWVVDKFPVSHSRHVDIFRH